MKQRTTKNRQRLIGSTQRCSANDKMENVSLVLIGGLLIVMGMMLRY